MVFGNILPVNPAPLPPPPALHPLTVLLSDSKLLGRFPETAIASMIQGGVPSERFVTSAIQPTLQLANLAALKNIVGSILEGWEYYDNYK